MEEYFKNSVIFYYKYLIENRDIDPIKTIIGHLMDTIQITDEQRHYMEKLNDKELKMIDNLLILVDKMIQDEEYNEKYFKYLKEGLSNIKE